MARRACTSLPFHDGSVEEEKGPTFFKIIRPGFNTEHLRIPPAFRKHILHESIKRATLKLKNSSDTSWTVKVIITGRDIYLKDGWQEFLRDNSLGDSEFLVFRTHKAPTFPDNPKGPLARPPTGDHRYDLAVEAAHVLKSKGEHLPSYAAAAAFKSKFPYFAKVLAGSKMVAIPTHFYREIFSSSKYDELFLVTAKGKFTVTLLPCTDTVMLSGGWSSFRNDNQLQEDDICIFELVKENTMVVHIFRN
ncbi:B3 domain-containing protein Os01g0723500 isoform X4 [Rosa chinensis]|uniref:B3 domain-containing protein Os01g0723500 isoform X4 n=1 Tax=Rosa chinensis TaxID=74649 RepID=UPI001AD91F5C|nr:B3 domain-containing protein Os01g0723500 isoform X4 [Rosa chinensis]